MWDEDRSKQPAMLEIQGRERSGECQETALVAVTDHVRG